MNIEFDKTTMDTLVQKAIFDSLTEEKRNELLVGAIRKITEPVGGAFNGGRSVLTEVFQSAARNVAESIVSKKLEESEQFKAEVESLYLAVVKKLFDQDIRDKLVEQITNSVVNGLHASRY